MSPGDVNYSNLNPLRSGVTWLARDQVNRLVVLKLMPPDCLWRGQIHPNVKDRLERLREVPGTGFQALTGVEVIEMGVVSVTPYVEGTNLRNCNEEVRQASLQQLPRIVSSLHRLGMVHGAINAGNIIVDTQGKTHLIDPSPLLHDDFDADLRALEKLGCLPQLSAAPESYSIDQDHALRRRSLIGAAALVLAGIGVAWLIRVYLAR